MGGEEGEKPKADFFIYLLINVPAFTDDHRILSMSRKTKLRMHVTEIRYLWDVSVLRGRSSDIQEGFGVHLLLLRQLKWF